MDFTKLIMPKFIICFSFHCSKAVLKWHEEHVDIVGSSVKLNADCIIHATLEDDKTTLKCLYSYGYRLGPDTDRRINKVCDKSIN